MEVLFTILVFAACMELTVLCQSVDEMNDRLFYMQYGMLYRHYDYYWPRENNTFEIVTLDKLTEYINELIKQPTDVQMMTKIDWPRSALDPQKDRLFRQKPCMIMEKLPPINVTIVGYVPAATISFCSPHRMAPFKLYKPSHRWDYVLTLDKLELNHTFVV